MKEQIIYKMLEDAVKIYLGFSLEAFKLGITTEELFYNYHYQVFKQ